MKISEDLGLVLVVTLDLYSQISWLPGTGNEGKFKKMMIKMRCSHNMGPSWL